MGYFDLQPERRPLHLNQDEDDPHELNIRAPVEIDIEPPHRSDVTTASVNSPMLIPEQDLPTRFVQNCRRSWPAPTVLVRDKNAPPKVTATTAHQTGLRRQRRP